MQLFNLNKLLKSIFFLKKSACPDIDRMSDVRNANHRNLVGFIRGWVQSKSREVVSQETNRLFGKDLKEHLDETELKGNYLKHYKF